MHLESKVEIILILKYLIRYLIITIKYLTFESMCPLTIKLPVMSIIVPPTKRRAANVMAFHGIFTGGFTNC